MEDQIEKKDLSSDLINQDLRNLEIENDQELVEYILRSTRQKGMREKVLEQILCNLEKKVFYPAMKVKGSGVVMIEKILSEHYLYLVDYLDQLKKDNQSKEKSVTSILRTMIHLVYVRLDLSEIDFLDSGHFEDSLLAGRDV